MFKNGYIPWNKGINKNNDARMKNAGEKSGKSRKGKRRGKNLKISEKLKGNQHFKGKHHTKESKEKIRITIKNKWMNNKEYIENHKDGSIKQSLTLRKTLEEHPEIIENLTKSHKGKPSWNSGKVDIYSDETIERISNATKEQWKNKEYRKFMEEKILPNARHKQASRISSIEIMIANELRRRNINFIQQVMILNRYKVDFLIEDCIIIEADGDYWHNLPNIKEKDNKRDVILDAERFIIFRFWEHEIRKDVSKCVDKIVEKFPHLNNQKIL